MGCLIALMCHHIRQPICVSKILLPIPSLLLMALYLYTPIKEVNTWSISVFVVLSGVLLGTTAAV